ncbi:peptide chain release factor family protein [Lignipirellula cremea]|uniref:Peptide chain release factor 1 n=1 Tax=Lignipirellula cremea TaxID=2528010 RepID=A0A518DQ56_9BACT|nr:peptide chain release factor-like protein [Lignipirellula cremea]QDU93986.1 Peptide chain release factor 1 [Lignipirellula cremea]
MPPLHPAKLAIDTLLADCEVRRTRGSGPGGQHRNKVETAIVITHRPTGVRGEATERRSQEQNRQQAIHRLRIHLALQVRSEEAAETPSSLWQSRRQGERMNVSATHQDFPALLAESLDVLSRQQQQVPPAAAWLGVSSSQLIRLLKQEPHALKQVNEERFRLGLHALK